MASTEQKRKWYPEVVTNHADRGKAGYTPKCDPQRHAVRHTFPREGGGEWNLWVHPKTVEAWDAYEFLMKRHGETVPSDGGTHNCRNIAGTSWPSLHAYCVALDIPPNNRKSAAFQRDVLAVKTNSGVRVFKNLASINDRMHDEIDCSPAALASGIDWSTVAGFTGTPPPPSTGDDDDMFGLDIGVMGAPVVRGPKVAALQVYLTRAGFDTLGVDGIAGDNTRRALGRWKAAMAITQALSAGEGKIGEWEYGAMLAYAPQQGGGGITQAQGDARYARITHPHTVTIR